MPVEEINGTPLFYEMTGTGEPVVLVHGSWVDTQTWVLAAPALAETFQVIAYDRRGHGRSDCPPETGTVHDDGSDLAALITKLGIAPVNLVSNSFGAGTSLRLTIERPELVRRTVAHEPPLVALLADDPAAKPILDDFSESIEGVVRLFEAGDYAGAAKQFVEHVALGPGTWSQLPQPVQESFVRHAPTFLGEMNDPDALAIDVERLGRVSTPVMLSQGDQSPPIFAPIVERLGAMLPGPARHTYVGAGHVPHLTNVDDYVPE